MIAGALASLINFMYIAIPLSKKPIDLFILTLLQLNDKESFQSKILELTL